MATTEFGPKFETCTAVISLEQLSGEAYQGPISIGIYNTEELWIECEGHRINLPERHLNDILKQIKRARKITADMASE